MTTMTEERPPIRRLASGIDIDGARLSWWRIHRALSRQEVCDAIADLYRAGHPDALPFTHRAAVIRKARGTRTWTVRAWDPVARADGERSFRSRSAAREFAVHADAALPDHRVTLSRDGKTCRRCGAPVAGGLTRDSVAKFERWHPPGGQRLHDSRRPKPQTVRALAAALGIKPEDLMPDGPVPAEVLASDRLVQQNDGRTWALPPEVAAAQERDERNAAMRAFADSIGRPELYTNPSGRIFYYAELERLYAQYEREHGMAS